MARKSEAARILEQDAAAAQTLRTFDAYVAQPSGGAVFGGAVQGVSEESALAQWRLGIAQPTQLDCQRFSAHGRTWYVTPSGTVSFVERVSGEATTDEAADKRQERRGRMAARRSTKRVRDAGFAKRRIVPEGSLLPTDHRVTKSDKAAANYDLAYAGLYPAVSIRVPTDPCLAATGARRRFMEKHAGNIDAAFDSPPVEIETAPSREWKRPRGHAARVAALMAYGEAAAAKRAAAAK